MSTETEEEFGFFEVAGVIWAEADERRAQFKTDMGEELGNFIADVRQYGAGWTGDVWEWTAIGSEDHPAFATIPERHPWDSGPPNEWWSSAAERPSDWGGWTKPHKERSDKGVGIKLDPSSQWWHFMPESYL